MHPIRECSSSRSWACAGSPTASCPSSSPTRCAGCCRPGRRARTSISACPPTCASTRSAATPPTARATASRSCASRARRAARATCTTSCAPASSWRSTGRATTSSWRPRGGTCWSPAGSASRPCWPWPRRWPPGVPTGDWSTAGAPAPRWPSSTSWRATASAVEVVPQDEAGHPDLDALLGTPEPGVGVYCCGPEGLLDRGRGPLPGLAGGHAARRAVRRQGPCDDSDLRPFDVVLQRSAGGWPSGRLDSALDVLDAAGVQIPNACRDGICGSCDDRGAGRRAGPPRLPDRIRGDDRRRAAVRLPRARPRAGARPELFPRTFYGT